MVPESPFIQARTVVDRRQYKQWCSLKKIRIPFASKYPEFRNELPQNTPRENDISEKIIFTKTKTDKFSLKLHS